MKGKKILAGILAVTLLPLSVQAASAIADSLEGKQLRIPVEKELAKSEAGNPFLGFDQNGNTLYAGDPSILVDGDTVYAYVGNDTSSNESYWMPNWRCYSSTDMVNWKYESIIMENRDVSWAANDHEAWAAQVIKYKDKYYFYYTTEGNASVGRGKCIGVAVSDSPTGPFVDIGKPLVRNIDTGDAWNGGTRVPSAHTWEDIDPTAWVETDPETGEDRRVLCWGNNRFFNCELNEDMISIKDRDGDANTLSCGFGSTYDISVGMIDGAAGREVRWTDEDGVSHFYTEAPYYYRQQDEDGNYFGPYYMFFACDWREQMAYATADTYEDFVNNTWKFGRVIMKPTSTANTNHMAVFDFKGKTYFVYHNGSLPHGSGYRRVACVEELNIKEDGSIDLFTETSTGISGVSTKITDASGAYVAHENFTNRINDEDYPMSGSKAREMLVSSNAEENDTKWELEKGKANPDNKAYVSIQSYNKPGLYLCAEDTDIVLAQDADGSSTTAQKMTFRSLEGFSGSGVTFESVSKPGYYLTSKDGDLVLDNHPSAEACTFQVDTDTSVSSLKVMKTKRMYTVGSTLNTDDIRITAAYENGDTKRITEYTTNADTIDMSTTGKKSLVITYVENGTTVKETVTIRVVDKSETW